MSRGKYRAWDDDCEVMYYSDKEYDDCHFGFHEGVVVAWLRETEPQTLNEPAHDYGKPIDVEEHTGRKDLTGKDAYQHDIVKSKHYGTGKIVWLGDGWVVTGDNMGYSLSYDFTIIGDIHTTPKLLEQE